MHFHSLLLFSVFRTLFKDEWFSHLAIEVPGENGSNEWLEPVSDEVCVCNSIKQMLEASVIQLTGAFCNIKFTLLSTL